MINQTTSRLRHLLAFWLVTTVACIWIHPSDVREYRIYADEALKWPLLHAWPHEYPMLSLAVFLLPKILPLAYRWAFAVITGMVLWQLMVQTHEGPAWDRRLLGYLALASVGLFAGRYDIFPAAAAFFAVMAARQGQFTRAWTWSILGFLLKLFPVVLWPGFLIAEWRATGRWRWDRLAAGIGAGVLSVAVQALFSRQAAFSSYRYFLHRPLQLGSLSAGLAALVHFGRFHLMTSFGSINVMTAPGPVVADIVTGLSLGAVALVLGLAVTGRIDLETTSLSLLTLLILSSKVFSAQYLIWLIPLWALYAWRWQWLAAAMLTTLGYPVSFILAHQFGAFWLHWALWIDFCRDAMLLWGSVAWFMVRVKRTDVSSGILVPSRSLSG